MIERTGSIQIVGHSSKLLSLHETARASTGIAYLGLALLCGLVSFRLPPDFLRLSPSLWLIALLSLLGGINRCFGTTSTFDGAEGDVSITRTFGKWAVFRRRFSIRDVNRVFHDRRPYLKIKIQNPKLQLTSGRDINLSQWCPSTLDLEEAVAAANRMIHTWKKAEALARGQTPEPFSVTYANASPTNWTLEDLEDLGDQQRRRIRLWVRRSWFAFLLATGIYFSLKPFFAYPLIGIFAALSVIFLTSALIFSICWLADRHITRK